MLHELRRGIMVLAMAMAVVIMWGCNQVPGEESTVDESNDGPPAPSEQNEPECTVDADCESYYRCIEATCIVPPAMTGDPAIDTPIARLYEGEQLLANFYLELAITSQEQSRGLMYRPSMLDDWGMLFIYDEEQHLSFWMKNTLIPLDMIFVDGAGQVVGVVHEAEPETLTSRQVGEPARYVLEINGGLAAEYGIERGATMSLENVEDRYQPDH